MAAAPVYEETIPFKISAFKDVKIKAAIDRGTSLTKIVFIPKDTPPDADTVQLRCLTYANENFDDAIRVMKEQAQLPDTGELHVTGSGAANYRDKIKEELGLDMKPIGEIGTIGYGVYLLVNNAAEPKDIFHPIPNFKKWENSATMERVDEIMKENVVQSDDMFPAVVVSVSSGCAYLSVNKEGVSSLKGTVGLSGRPFMGLARVLLGTNDYDQIIKMAEKGDTNKADLNVGDLLKEDPDTPYGVYLPETPCFPFGRAANESWDRKSASKEDLAASLVRLVVYGLIMNLYSIINSSAQMSRVYLAGNFFRSEYVRGIFHEMVHLLFQAVDIKIESVKTGHGGAVASMLIDPEKQAGLME